jgi:hypothetical protein
LNEEDLTALLKGLQSKGLITVDENKVTYALPSDT